MSVLKSAALIAIIVLTSLTVLYFQKASEFFALGELAKPVPVEQTYHAIAHDYLRSTSPAINQSDTMWRYKDALSRLAKLKAVGTSHVATCKPTLEIGWRQPENLEPHFIGNRCEPWWVRDAIFLIHHIVLPSWKVLEWGGGSSTVWLSSHVASVTTIEDEGEWVKDLGDLLQKHNISNVQLRHRPKQGTGNLSSASKGCCYDDYIMGASDMPNGSFDLVSVDGRAREHCLKEAVRLVKPKGGVLVLDNYDRDRYQMAINNTIPKQWMRHYSNLLVEYNNITEAQKSWILKDNLFTTFWITRN